LLVCTGNTCRSPMAVGILRKILRPELLRRVEIDSAGVDARAGGRASDGALNVTRTHGIDISGHLTKQLTRALVQRADLILVMERVHMERVREMCPSKIEHVMLLTELGEPEEHEDAEIADPMGGSAEVYRHCFAQIQDVLTRGSQFLADLMSARGGSGEARE